MEQIVTVKRDISRGGGKWCWKKWSTVLQPLLSKRKLMGESLFGLLCKMWGCNYMAESLCSISFKAWCSLAEGLVSFESSLRKVRMMQLSLLAFSDQINIKYFEGNAKKHTNDKVPYIYLWPFQDCWVMDLAGCRRTADWLGVSVTDTAGEDKDVTHRAVKWCTAISKRVFATRDNRYLGDLGVLPSVTNTYRSLKLQFSFHRLKNWRGEKATESTKLCLFL